VRSWTAVLSILIFASAGCGSADSAPSGGPPPPSSGTIDALWRAPGEDVGLIQGTGDYAPGRIRVSFLVVRGDGRVVDRPGARVWLARGRNAKPFLSTTAALEPIGVPGGAEAAEDIQALYVTEVRVAKPGKYWLLAEPVGGKPIQALGNLVVKAKAAAPAVGARAIASATPTIASTGGDLDVLSTDSSPSKPLYRHSVADSLAARTPFVVTFATPKFCSSRTCGPTVDVVDYVRRKTDTAVRFLHVEIFEGNDPGKGVNRWVKEWKLPSEPWVFVVGRDGRIKAKFEGSVSVADLTRALRPITGP